MPSPPSQSVEQKPAPPAQTSLRDQVERHRADLLERLSKGVDGIALGRLQAVFLEDVMKAMFAQALAKTGEVPGGITLVAVGSFGRGAVALRSDADVRILVSSRGGKSGDAAKRFTEALLYPLWDSALSIGHQVMDSSDALDLAPTDLATATSLLDLRFLAGDPSLLKEILQRAWTGIFAEGQLARFIERLDQEAKGRHGRFGGSVYLLEPDVKNAAGGIRDLDSARWAARARFRVGENPSESVWHELVRLGVLVARESIAIAAAEEFVWRVRNRLHGHAARRADRLTFEEQESLAVAMGYGTALATCGGSAAAPPHPPQPKTTMALGTDRARAAEELMQQYYVYARVISRARERLLERAIPLRRRHRPSDMDLGRGVRLFDGQISIAGISELAQDPVIALRAYAACNAGNAPMLIFAREAIARAAADSAWCETLRLTPEASQLFVSLICDPTSAKLRAGSMVAELHDVGLLLAMVPEFAPVVGRVQHDVYHVYTVDVHSVKAVEFLHGIARGDHPEFQAARLLVGQEPRPLYLAMLLHDIGKGYPDPKGSRQDHSTVGAHLCTQVLKRLGLPAAEVEEAQSLVEQHLLMYHTATRRDLDDRVTIEDFVSRVRGRFGLNQLYLLTLADVSTTSPTAMTAWKSRMLDELFYAADSYLTDSSQFGFDEKRVAELWAKAGALWTGDRAFFNEFIGSMPEGYVLANEPESIVAHAHVVAERRGRAAHAALVPSRHAQVAELCVVADDRPGLLARMAGAITANRFEVLGAQVYTRAGLGHMWGERGCSTPPPPAENNAADTPHVEAVDLFWIKDRTDGADGVERASPRLVADLVEVCSGAVEAADLLRRRTGSSSPWRERPSPAVTTEVLLDDRASSKYTVVEVFAKDRPGLLYTLAQTLHELGLSIYLSKINTEGTKVADVFYVSELDGSKVRPGERHKAVSDALIRAIGAV